MTILLVFIGVYFIIDGLSSDSQSKKLNSRIQRLENKIKVLEAKQ